MATLDVEYRAPRTSASRARSAGRARRSSDAGQSRFAMGPMSRGRKKFVLCFDGTGNKFSGTDADSNILKIYRMLDRNDNSQFHYYQPGIGTYVTTSSLSHTSRVARIKSWYAKAKDAAVGTSFADHVMGGYKFLMRYYSPGDDIYFFGFSRGAYTARFLAEMLDHVGLLTAGNEEMARFAWKTFQKWQTRQDRTEEEKKEKKEMLEFMLAFRETFSRPVKPICFLGLFDTVNSVPTFENAWMQRSKFPYTARSTSKVIRHAVAIDERRAKFRQDLISEVRANNQAAYHRHHRHLREMMHIPSHAEDSEETAKKEEADRARPRSAHSGIAHSHRYNPSPSRPHHPHEHFRDASELLGVQKRSPNIRPARRDTISLGSTASQDSLAIIQGLDDDDGDDDNDKPQDIQEVWFAGCHADIGGGWDLAPGEEVPLSHVPLVWMVREAERAGLRFDPVKLKALNCCPGEEESFDRARRETLVPDINVTAASPKLDEGEGIPPIASAVAPGSTGLPGPVIAVEPPSSPDLDRGKFESDSVGDKSVEASDLAGTAAHQNADEAEGRWAHSHFHKHLQKASTLGRIHDVLQFNNGLPASSVVSWNMMEYLPFRRMDLQPDGSWESITWPLPKGEVRDIPDNVVVHNSVIKRMLHDSTYRPGNLIIGGGGRGVRKAGEEWGIGKWKVLREEGDAVGEVWIRSEIPNREAKAEKAE